MPITPGKFETVLIFVSSGVASGASGIGITADGHIVHVPSNNPEALGSLIAGNNVLQVAQTTRDETLRAELTNVGTKLIRQGAKAIQETGRQATAA